MTFAIQDGLPKLYEFNTNILYVRPTIDSKGEWFIKLFINQSVDTLHVVGIKYYDNLSNPLIPLYNELSSSCAATDNISSSLILDIDGEESSPK